LSVVSPAVPIAAPPRVELLERGRELALLGELLGGAAGGRGRLALVEGVAGIGKTSLLEAVGRHAAASGFAVRRARGSEVEREFAFGVVHQALDPGLAVELDPGSEPAGDRSYAVLRRLHRLFARLSAEAPLLLVVDDAHWADLASLRFLNFLARRLEGLPLLLLLGTRPEGLEPGGGPLGELAHHPGTAHLHLRPLSEEATGGAVRSRLGAGADGALGRACHEASGGNPFLLDELLAELERESVDGVAPSAARVKQMGPRRIATRVLLRVQRLGTSATALVRAAAVLGSGAPLRQAAALAELDSEAAANAADQLAGADLIRLGEPLEFVHPIIRTALYEEIPYRERVAAHRRAAQLLAAEGTAPDRVAAHLLRTTGEGDPGTVTLLREVARQAGAGGASDSAIAYLRRALEEPPDPDARGEVLLELGRAEMLLDGPAADAHLEEAIRLATDPMARAEACEAHAWALFFARRTAASVATAGAGIAAVGDRPGPLRSRLAAVSLTAQLHDPQFTAAASDAVERARDAGGEPDMALVALGAWRDLLAGDSRAPAGAARALQGGELLADGGGETPVLAGLVLALAGLETGLETFEKGVAVAREQGSMLAFACHKIFAGRARYLRGDLAGAAADLEEGLESSPIQIGEIWAASWLADVRREQGDLVGAERALARAGGGEIDDLHALWALDGRARVLLARGETRTGLAASLECGRRFGALAGQNPAVVPWRSQAALALGALGEEPEEARRLVEEEVRLARDWGAPRALGIALRAAGLLAGGETAIELLSESVAVLRPGLARLELARALTDLGAAQRRSGRRRQARESLVEGLELAEECGAAPLAALARQELDAAGGPTRSALRGPPSLTPSERRVTERARRGLTNREIAADLYVTVKTVETHLRNAYRKLEIRSRGELAEALGDAAE
jgi:DNA-binding CsgD family transcriptional regulator